MAKPSFLKKLLPTVSKQNTEAGKHCQRTKLKTCTSRDNYVWLFFLFGNLLLHIHIHYICFWDDPYLKILQLWYTTKVIKVVDFHHTIFLKSACIPCHSLPGLRFWQRNGLPVALHLLHLGVFSGFLALIQENMQLFDGRNQAETTGKRP